jgi:5-methylthioribose kinase
MEEASRTSADVEATSAEIGAILVKLGLQPIAPPQPLTGGVSCEVFRVDLATGPVAVKRALAQLRVAADWRAPLERSHSEVNWLQAVAAIPGIIAPEVLAESRAENLFVMSWFDPADHPVWKSELADGRVDPSFAAEVGGALGCVHAAAARNPGLEAGFRTEALFEALRLQPYLLETARRHPDLADALQDLSRRTLARRISLVHGDVSPKNILVGPRGPVFLDAECAWWGDPAFDLAFCLNHLLLKSVWRPQHAAAYARAFQELRQAYLTAVDWEPWPGLEARAAHLLGALLLARVDGKSPVEYLSKEADRDFVRAAGRAYVANPPPSVAALAADWAKRIANR